MTARFLRHAIRKDLARVLVDRVALTLYLGIPLVIGFTILLLVGGDRPKPVARLLVADEDGSAVSEFFTTVLRSEEASEFLRVESIDRADGRAVVDEGDASALLVIPVGFQDAVLRETPVQLELVTNPAESIMPLILTVGLEVLTDGVFYAHRILRGELAKIVEATEGDEAPTDETVAEISVGISRVVRKVRKYVSPPAILLEAVADEEDGGDGVPMANLMLPRIVLMGLLLMAQGLASDVWTEKTSGTLSRMVSVPRPMAALLFGKLLVHALLLLVVSFVLLTIGMLFLDIPLTRLPLALAWTTLSGVTFVLLFMWIFVHSRTRRAGMVISNSIIFPLMMLGGSFFPSEIMPTWMGAVGRWTPNGWSFERLKDILTDRADAAGLLLGVAGLLTVSLLFFLHTTARLRGTFAQR